jgi:ubiquinone biosynthesis protein UbiJ
VIRSLTRRILGFGISFASNILSTYDAAFIVAAPSDYDAMLGEIERLRAQVARLEARLSTTERPSDE